MSDLVRTQIVGFLTHRLNYFYLTLSDSKLFETTAVLKSKNDKLKEENLSLQIKVDNAGYVSDYCSQNVR